MAENGEQDWRNRQNCDETYRQELQILFKELRSQSLSNAEYFKDSKAHYHERFHQNFIRLCEHLEKGVEPGIEALLREVHLYDLDPDLPANGYRSMINVVHKCCLKLIQLVRHISFNRDAFLFRKGHYSRELEAYVTVLGQLRACLYYLQKLIVYCEDGCLFPNEDTLPEDDYRTAEKLMEEVESLSQEAFYGRCLGFQYCDSMMRPLSTINLVMASFSEGYDQSSTVMKLASSVIGGGKYLLDPELRAHQVVNVTRNGDIRFCKAFWSLAENELMHNLPLFVCPAVAIDKVIILPPECFELPLLDGSDTAKITPPCAHSGTGPVHTRLISHHIHQGQETWRPREPRRGSPNSPHTVKPTSHALVLHCHGGGFVAQSSASHEVYLRHWAKALGCPIFCVDYSLAPEHPFPRQLEEIFFAYCWALNNASLLGTTAEKICVVGDSAGGNLAVAVAMRAASYGIRVPDAVLSIYGCMLVKYTPSPSRLMSLMDPLLPLGIVSKCLAAYAGTTNGVKFTFPSNSAPTSHAPTPTSPTSTPTHSSYSEGRTPQGEAAPIPTLTPTCEGTPDPCSTPDLAATAAAANGFYGDEDEDRTPNDSDECGTCSGAGTGVTAAAYSDDVVGQAAVDKACGIDDTGAGNSVPDKESCSDDSSEVSPICPKLLKDKYKCHRPSASGDSGFHDCGTDHAPSDAAASRHLPTCDTIPPSAADAGVAPSGAEGQQKEGESPVVMSNHDNMPSVSPNSSPTYVRRVDKAMMSLDLSSPVATRRRVREVGGGSGGMIRSPSSPILPSSPRSPPHYGESPLSWSPSSWAVDSCPYGNVITPTYAKLRHFAQSPVQYFRHLPIAKNPYMSPYLAPDEMLKDLPPIYFLACALDPMLDDSIMLAKRLRKLNLAAHVDIVEDLPHGFLNFTLVSRHAKMAADLCVTRLADILGLSAWGEAGDKDGAAQEAARGAEAARGEEVGEEWEVLNREEK